MIDWIVEYVLRQPSRITNTGRNLVWWGGMLLVLGAICRIITAAANISFANGATETKILDDIYPGLLRWWLHG